LLGSYLNALLFQWLTAAKNSTRLMNLKFPRCDKHLKALTGRVAMQAVFSAASIALTIVILLSAIAKSADVKHEAGKGVQQIQVVAQTK
jgi:hypothetical protein